MKKAVRPTGNVRLYSIVDSNGINFRVREVSLLGARNFRNRNQHVSVFNRYEKLQEMSKRLKKFFLIIFPILLFCTFIFTFINIIIAKFAWASLLIMLGIVSDLPAFSIFCLKLKKDPVVLEFCKYLAAKNVVENAFYDLNRLPQYSEIDNYSLFSYSDVYLYPDLLLIYLMLCVINCFIGMPFHLFLLVLIVYMIMRRADIRVLCFQRLVTAEPENKHYVCAMEKLGLAFDAYNRPYSE